MACEGKIKGKIFFTDQGIKKEVIVSVAPFFVSCNLVGSCGKTGNRTITYNVANPAASSQNGSTSIFASFKDEVPFFKAVPQSGTYDGNRYDLWGNCHGIERLISQSFSLMSGAISIINNVFATNPASTGLVITDSSDNVLFNIAVSECSYSISCDDDCPPGFHKCTHKKYPGYCCVPCEEVGQRINNIANKIR